MHFDWSMSSFTFTGVYNSCVCYFSCWILKLRKKVLLRGAAGAGLAGGKDLGFGLREMVGFPAPSGDLEPANQYAPSEKPTGELKSPPAPKLSLNKSLRRLYQ